MIERDDANQLRWVRRSCRVQIIDAPHSVHKFLAGEDPPAAQAAQSECLGETAGHHKLIAKMKCRARAVSVKRLQIHFVHEHSRAARLCDISDGAHGFFIGISAAGIVQVGQDDQLGQR